MLFNRKPKPVVVRLVDFTTGHVVGRTEVDPANVPDSWETMPTFTLGEEWELLDARPMRRDAVLKEGRADLIVRRPPATGEGAVYAEPTISATVAPMAPGSMKAGVRRYQILPEDWRQIEFVSLTRQEAVTDNLTAIRGIIEADEVEDGFANRHVRVGVDAPLLPDVRITLDEFKAIFEDELVIQDGLSIAGVAGLVENGFAFATASLTEFFGATRDGAIEYLCIGGIGSHEYDSPEVQALADFTLDKGLAMVEWPSGLQYNPDSEEFFQFFDPAEHVDETAPV